MNKKFSRSTLIVPNVTENLVIRDEKFEKLGLQLKDAVNSIFGRSLAIRELDAGSDNSTEIEMVNLTTPYYDVERFGITFVASPRHADILAITGAVTHNMEIAVKKTYDAMPSPKFVVAVGDDACSGGIFKNTYAVRNGAETVIPVDMKIPGNPPTPVAIMTGLLGLMHLIRVHKIS
ncbi:MAG TPA: NADH-quinone oxidoreductase subunit B family protein [Dehalococcoidales bacterium]|nr:NADH-quinone oxidoreductase subunit B family protein [Dehalococcoidales bacterium]